MEYEEIWNELRAEFTEISDEFKIGTDHLDAENYHTLGVLYSEEYEPW